MDSEKSILFLLPGYKSCGYPDPRSNQPLHSWEGTGRSKGKCYREVWGCNSCSKAAANKQLQVTAGNTRARITTPATYSPLTKIPVLQSLEFCPLETELQQSFTLEGFNPSQCEILGKEGKVK